MSVLIYLIPISLVLLGFAVWAFFWAVQRNQFDNLDTPAIDILADDRNETAARSTSALRLQRAQRATKPKIEATTPPEPGPEPDAAAAAADTPAKRTAEAPPAPAESTPRPHAD